MEKKNKMWEEEVSKRGRMEERKRGKMEELGRGSVQERKDERECAADFSLLNLPKGKSLGRSKPATNS